SVPGTVAVGHVFHLFRTPVDLRHLGAVGQRLAVAGIAGVIRIDQQGIRQDHSHHLVAGVTYGDNRPAFVSLNSENARPPDTCTVYLSGPVSCAVIAPLPKTASTAAMTSVSLHGIPDMAHLP